MVSPLEQLFPELAGGAYRVTSPQDRDYNCIAWTVGDSHHWWWPGRDVDREYWRLGVPRERTRGAFVLALSSVGYTVCEGEGLETGYEKVALFVDVDGRPSHAARQLPDGRWSSKLGKMENIEHGLRDLEGTL
jgi:hypothetical protein